MIKTYFAFDNAIGRESSCEAIAAIWCLPKARSLPRLQPHSHTHFSWEGSSLQRLHDPGLVVLCSFETLSQTGGALNPKTTQWGDKESLKLLQSAQAAEWGCEPCLSFSVRMLLLQLKPTQTPSPCYCLLPQWNIWHLRHNGKSKNVRNLVTQHRVYYTSPTV